VNQSLDQPRFSKPKNKGIQPIDTSFNDDGVYQNNYKAKNAVVKKSYKEAQKNIAQD